MPVILLLLTFVAVLGSVEIARRAVIGRQLEASLRLVPVTESR